MVDKSGHVERSYDSKRLRDVEQWLVGRGFEEVKQ